MHTWTPWAALKNAQSRSALSDLRMGFSESVRQRCSPDDDAGQIFLEFDRVELASKAVVDLNGRYFGG